MVCGGFTVLRVLHELVHRSLNGTAQRAVEIKARPSVPLEMHLERACGIDPLVAERTPVLVVPESVLYTMEIQPHERVELSITHRARVDFATG